MVRLLTILLLGSVVTSAFGQGRDTAFAIQKLFSQKRGSARGMATMRDSMMSKAYNAERAGRALTTQEIRQDALVNTTYTMVGMLKAARYSIEEEAYILRLYAAGQPIPATIRRKLRRKHFHVSARDLAAPL